MLLCFRFCLTVVFDFPFLMVRITYGRVMILVLVLVVFFKLPSGTDQKLFFLMWQAFSDLIPLHSCMALKERASLRRCPFLIPEKRGKNAE